MTRWLLFSHRGAMATDPRHATMMHSANGSTFVCLWPDLKPVERACTLPEASGSAPQAQRLQHSLEEHWGLVSEERVERL